MARYELAKKSEEYVQNLAEEINRSLKDAELIQLEHHGRKRAVLMIRDPFNVNEKDYFNGFASVHIKFNKETPEFLNNEDYNLWHEKMRKLAKKMFEVDWTFRLNRESHYVSIDFAEPSEGELYALTQNKKETFQKGFERIKNYIKWYNTSIKEYEKVIESHSEKRNKYLTELENLVLA